VIYEQEYVSIWSDTDLSTSQRNKEFPMGSNIGSLRSGIKEESATGPRLSGISQTIAIVLWGLVTLTSLLSLSFSAYSLNLWDRIPAAETIRYFPDMTPEGTLSNSCGLAKHNP